MVCPSYWSRPGTRAGRPRRVSLRRSACGCGSARLLVLPPLRPLAVNVPHRARVPQAAVDAFGHQVLRPPYWSRHTPRSGRSSAALVRKSACGGCAARLPPDGCSTPVRVRRGPEEGPIRPCSGRRKAREGPSTPSPGLGLLPTVQLAGPMPRDMPLSRIRGYNEALCAKVNVSDPARRRPSHHHYHSSYCGA